MKNLFGRMCAGQADSSGKRGKNDKTPSKKFVHKAITGIFKAISK